MPVMLKAPSALRMSVSSSVMNTPADWLPVPPAVPDTSMTPVATARVEASETWTPALPMPEPVTAPLTVSMPVPVASTRAPESTNTPCVVFTPLPTPIMVMLPEVLLTVPSTPPALPRTATPDAPDKPDSLMPFMTMSPAPEMTRPSTTTPEASDGAGTPGRLARMGASVPLPVWP